MSFLFSLIVAFAVGFSSAPMNGPEQPTTAPVTVQQVSEVDPILSMDAVATLEDHALITQEFTNERGHHYVATYVESSPSSDSKYGEFTLESLDFPGTFHHYAYMQHMNA